MNSMYQSLRTENGSLRGLSGSGEPGLWTLLGGTSAELEAGQLKFSGGAGQVGSTAKLARAHKDVRLAAVAAGTAPSGSGGGSAEDTPRDRDRLK